MRIGKKHSASIACSKLRFPGSGRGTGAGGAAGVVRFARDREAPGDTGELAPGEKAAEGLKSNEYWPLGTYRAGPLKIVRENALDL